MLNAPAPSASTAYAVGVDEFPGGLVSAPADPVRDLLDRAPMSAGQVLAVALTVLMALVDGYDLLSMSLVAPVVGHDWALSKATLGALLASGLAGAAAGSLLVTPFADLLGRKPMLMAGLALTCAATLLSAACRSAPELTACRLATGVGIGVMVPLITALAAEYSNARHRGLAVAFSTVGQPAGGIIGGLVASIVLRHQGWTPVFLWSGLATVALIPVVWLCLPESTAFLTSRRPPRALQRVNRVLEGFGHAPLPALPPRSPNRRVAYGALFAPGAAANTVRFTVVNVLLSMAAFFLITWLPQLMTDAGFAPATASLVLVVVSVVGIPGALVLGALAAGSATARLAAGAMVAYGAALAALGFAPAVLPLVLACAGACGFFFSGCAAVFYAALADVFPPLTCASGIGFVMGVGRVFSALGPLVAGWLFAAGATRGAVASVFAVGCVLAGLLFITAPARAPSRPASQP